MTPRPQPTPARRLRVLVLCVAAAAAGCVSDGPDNGDILRCEERRIEADRLIDERWSDPNGCVADCQCVRGATDIACPNGAWLGACGRAIHRDSTEQFAALVEDVRGELCPRVAGGCFGGPGCGYEPACVEGRCMLVDPRFTDAGPADAGTPDGGAVDVCDPAP